MIIVSVCNTEVGIRLNSPSAVADIRSIEDASILSVSILELDTIVVAPSQMLSESDYDVLRSTAINVIRHLGVMVNVTSSMRPNLIPKHTALLNTFIIQQPVPITHTASS